MKNTAAKVLLPWLVLGGAAWGVVAAWDRGQPAPAESTTAAVDDELDDHAAAEAATFDLLVDYRDDAGAAVLAATPWNEEALGPQTAVDKLFRIRFDDFADARAAAQSLQHNPAVESVDWDVPVALSPDEATALAPTIPNAACEGKGQDQGDAATATKGFPDDPCYRYQWHMNQVGLPAAWKMGQGKGVTVAVIDTGVSAVPDLAGIELVEGYNFVAGSPDARDDHGHGTHVAGTIAQATNNHLGVAGVAFGAKIMPLKVLSASGSGSMGAIAQAIRYAADHGAQVINMSLGGPFPTSAIRNAVKYARGKGVTVVAAAGNDGRGKVGYPAKYPEVFAVAATQFDETTTFYSNWGPEVDIAGPGGNVRVDQNGDGKPDGVLQNTVVPGNTSKTDYLLFMGTSMASPHVAGVAALVVGAGVTKPDAVEGLLRATARNPKRVAAGDAPRRVDDHYGAGIVDAQAALSRAKSVTGAGGLGLAGALALVGLSGLRRRGRLGKLGGGFAGGMILGASGLFFLPLLLHLPGPLAALGVGMPEMIPAAFAGFGQGNPLLFGALLPLGAVALLGGVRPLRGWIGGLCFGIAGALAVSALLGAMNVTFMPDALDRAWLVVNAAVCALLGRAVMRR
jgi:serine protease